MLSPSSISLSNMLTMWFYIVLLTLYCFITTPVVVVAAPPSTSTTTAYSGTDIVTAIEQNNMEKLSIILNSRSIDVDTQGANSWTGLLYASRMLNEEAVQRLLRAGARPYIAEKDGWTPLHFATALNSVSISKMLIKAGADLQQQNTKQQSAAKLAEASKNEAMHALYNAALADQNRVDQYDGKGKAKFEEYQKELQLRAKADAAKLQPGVQRAPEQQQQKLPVKPVTTATTTTTTATAGASKNPPPPTSPHKNPDVSTVLPPPKAFNYDHMFELARSGDLVQFRTILHDHATTRTNPPSPPFNWGQRSPKGFSVLLYLTSSNTATIQQQVDFVRYILDLKAAGAAEQVDLNSSENDGWTALMFATHKGNDRVVSMLLEAGADALLRNKKGATAYELAVQFGKKELAVTIGNAAVIQLLRFSLTESGRADERLAEKLTSVIISTRCDANTVIPHPDFTGITPLMLVAIRDTTGQMVESLVTKGGADPYARDAHGWSVCMYAIAARQIGVLRKLISLAGSDADIAKLFTAAIGAGDGSGSGSGSGDSPVSVAADTGNKDIIDLVTHYSTLASKTAGTATAAATTATMEGSSSSSSSSGSGSGSAYHGKRVRTSDWDSRRSTTTSSSGTGSSSSSGGGGGSLFSPPITVIPNKYAVDIIDAINKNNIAGVRYFINDGGDIHYANKGGFTALHTAVSKGYADIVRLLLQHGANVNAAENDGWTPLMFASYHGRIDLIDLLLDSGADPLSANKFKRTAYDLAINNGHKQVGARVASEAILTAIRQDDVDLIQLLLRAGANPSAFDSDSGRTPLMVFVRHPSVTAELIDAFLNDFSFVDLNTKDKDGNTALFHAIAKGDVPTVSTLIAHGADTNRRNKAGYTPLETAKLRKSGPSIKEVINVLERFPTADSMQRALASLRNIQNKGNVRLSLKDAAAALSEPTIDPALLASSTGGTATSSTGRTALGSKTGNAGGKASKPVDLQEEAEELRKQNAELHRSLEQIATKARQEYSTKAKERALQEKQHKDRVMAAEKKKLEESNKSWFAKLLGW